MSPFRGQLSSKPQLAIIQVSVVPKLKHKGARKIYITIECETEPSGTHRTIPSAPSRCEIWDSSKLMHCNIIGETLTRPAATGKYSALS
jgi:hypothetical protein